MTAAIPPGAIELRVDRIAQLFHSLDPYPFRERDLDKDAEDYIVGWARELDPGWPIAIIVHAPESQAQSKAARSCARPLPDISLIEPTLSKAR